jgi:curved DNA-binding protein CbpA
MRDAKPVDYYEVLQISPNAEPETIQRIYRLLAQRYHPDNRETGDANRFRVIHEAYSVLSNPESRVKYDVTHAQQQQDRWRLVSFASGAPADRNSEKAIRLTVLELLSARRRLHPNEPGLFPNEIEKLTGVPQEHLEFSTWYLIQKKLVQRSDSSRLVITVEGVDYLDESPHVSHTAPRLMAAREQSVA